MTRTSAKETAPSALFCLRFEARPLRVRAALQDIRTALRRTALCPECQGDLQLLLAEVLNNVVEHAYAGRAPGEVCVRAAESAAEVHIVVRDRGGPLPNEAIPQVAPADLFAPVENLPEGGFGWLLIQTLASRVEYYRSDGENRLELWVPAVPA
ncbi:ATP-binding protein [Aestuariicoccus sp. MJ-SS9]|uniref:ATP-binding protein n=1 Tax=Aestuariicoccus sp. MJ-SS9 TaxID=3079855 RepID=UPI00292CAFC4|nr:ATP-binding protein [Aestuariicoccus sp. MJ-SS9]